MWLYCPHVADLPVPSVAPVGIRPHSEIAWPDAGLRARQPLLYSRRLRPGPLDPFQQMAHLLFLGAQIRLAGIEHACLDRNALRDLDAG